MTRALSEALITIDKVRHGGAVNVLTFLPPEKKKKN